LGINIHGNSNTAVGSGALVSATGSNNIAVGAGAGGSVLAGSNNINIGSVGANTSNNIRIGNSGDHTATFIQGIRDVDPPGMTEEFVVIAANGQLGSVAVAFGSVELMNKLETAIAQQQKEIKDLTAQLKEQAAQIQKVSAQLEVSKPAPKTVANK
jgi:hypothetical protein